MRLSSELVMQLHGSEPAADADGAYDMVFGQSQGAGCLLRCEGHIAVAQVGVTRVSAEPRNKLTAAPEEAAFAACLHRPHSPWLCMSSLSTYKTRKPPANQTCSHVIRV